MNDYFGTVTNLAVSFGVTFYGAFAWLRGKGEPGEASFRYRAYVCWWASWLAWVVAWSLLLFSGAEGKGDSIQYKAVTLLCDNLNSIFLILTFLVITRGKSFDWDKIRLSFNWIAGSLAMCLIMLYSLSHFSHSLGAIFAYDVHKTWGLCLGVAAPILVGWAFNLRFNTVLPLAVGFVYGFVQPIVYATELQVPGTALYQVVVAFQPVIAMTLAALKVVWAIVFTQVLLKGVASADNLVAERTTPESHAFVSWDQRLVGQVVVLCGLYLILAVSMILDYSHKYKELLDHLATALGIVGGIIGLLDFLWTIWRRLWDRIDKGQQLPRGGRLTEGDATQD